MAHSEATGKSYLYQGNSATTHTITHNLNSQWVNFEAFVTSSGLRTTDFASVTATNANTLVIVLNNAAAISVRVTT